MAARDNYAQRADCAMKLSEVVSELQKLERENFSQALAIAPLTLEVELRRKAKALRCALEWLQHPERIKP